MRERRFEFDFVFVVDAYAKFLDALGYEVIVQPKTARDPKEGSYKVGVEE